MSRGVRGGAERLLWLQRNVGNRAAIQQIPRNPANRFEIQRLNTRGQRRKTRYETLPGDMDDYAKRQGQDSDFEGHRSDVVKALSLPRNPDGSLSAESIAIMDRLQAEQAQGYRDAADAAGPENAPTTKAELKDYKKRVKERGKQSVFQNKATGKTDMPELANMMKLSQVPEQNVMSMIDMGGVTLQVHHGTRDVNLKPRLAMFKTAIKKIQSAGFTLPAQLVVHLPKWGRGINAEQLCETAGGTPRAVFNPPNFIHLSSAVVGNPIDTVIGDYYKNLSTELDLSGASSVVHEMGHLMHYTTSASNFYSLHGTSFQGEGARIAAKVSAYAFGNPREFVAEVFMGLVYGQNFDDEILAMYGTFGGPMSGKIQGRIDKARAKGTLAHERKKAPGAE